MKGNPIVLIIVATIIVYYNIARKTNNYPDRTVIERLVFNYHFFTIS